MAELAVQVECLPVEVDGLGVFAIDLERIARR
jgi:hypothetical protein